MFQVKSRVLGVFSAVAMVLAPIAALDAMTVQPVVINLETFGNSMSQVITVENTFANPLPVELRVEELTFSEDGLVGTKKDPGDLLIFPPQAMIQPGQTQAFRVQYIGDPELAKSKHYYVTVAQLPVKLPEGQSAIQVLYNFQVLVSIAPKGGVASLQVASAEVGKNEKGEPTAFVTLNNPSNAHGYLSKGKLRLVQKDAAGKEIFRQTLSGPEILQTIGFGLVGAGQTRKVMIPVTLPQSGGTLDAQFTPEK